MQAKIKHREIYEHMDRLIEPNAAPREVCIGCELIVRESCGASLRGKVRS